MENKCKEERRSRKPEEGKSFSSVKKPSWLGKGDCEAVSEKDVHI